MCWSGNDAILLIWPAPTSSSSDVSDPSVSCESSPVDLDATGESGGDGFGSHGSTPSTGVRALMVGPSGDAAELAFEEMPWVVTEVDGAR